jgi:hypothetical protein
MDDTSFINPSVEFTLQAYVGYFYSVVLFKRDAEVLGFWMKLTWNAYVF